MTPAATGDRVEWTHHHRHLTGTVTHTVRHGELHLIDVAWDGRPDPARFVDGRLPPGMLVTRPPTGGAS